MRTARSRCGNKTSHALQLGGREGAALARALHAAQEGERAAAHHEPAHGVEDAVAAQEVAVELGALEGAIVHHGLADDRLPARALA